MGQKKCSRNNKKNYKKKGKISFFKKTFNFFSSFCKKVFGFNKNNIKICVGIVDTSSSNQDFFYVVVFGKKKNILVEKKDMFSAMDGDKVLVEVYLGKTNKGYNVGRIVKILKRKCRFLVGTLKNDGKNNFYLDIKGKRLTNKVLIDKKTVPTETKRDSRVKVEIYEYPKNEKQNFLSRLIEVFGQVGDHESEIKTILNSYSLPEKFNQKILDEANDIKINIEEEKKHRKDFREVFTVTIDPENAKDFDDAISFKKINDDVYEIGIHIADVSFFVKEKTNLDFEAYKRNTSIYLIDRVIPMLPEKLCNDLCSLVQNEDRLTMSIVLEINSKGEIIKEWIGETIINSNKRMTYEEAQKVIFDEKEEFHEILSTMFNISKILRQRRFENGAINFNFDDLSFSVDGDNLLKITKSECTESHNMIEEFMLLANEHIANYVYNLNKNKHPVFVYRIHESPQIEKINEFCTIMKNFKIKIDNNPKKFTEQLNILFEKIKGREDENIISTLAVRTMQRAIYSIKPLGHFGLAFKHYTHFTSPIRRYADVIVHRLLKKYIKGIYDFNYYKYEKMCSYANEREIIATDAERDSIKFKQVDFLSKHIGEKYEGIVTGITDFGMFVEIKNIHCDGFLRFSECKYDYFYYDKTYLKVIGKYTGNTYCIGTNINVIIKNCNIEKGIIDLSFI